MSTRLNKKKLIDYLTRVAFLHQRAAQLAYERTSPGVVPLYYSYTKEELAVWKKQVNELEGESKEHTKNKLFTEMLILRIQMGEFDERL